MNGFQQALHRVTDPEVRRRIRMEEKMVEALVEACLDRGYAISIHDGEDWAIIFSTDKAKIMAEFFATDEDTIVVRRAEDRTKVGWFRLVYGNDGYDVISDYSANPICDEIWETVLRPLSDKLEEGLA